MVWGAFLLFSPQTMIKSWQNGVGKSLFSPQNTHSAVKQVDSGPKPSIR